MRRKSQGDGWGFTPVLQNEPLFPKSFVSRLNLEPTGAKEALSFAGIDVVISRKTLVFRHHSFGIFKTLESVSLDAYIGVAVHYTPAPTHWRFSNLLKIEGLRSLIPNSIRTYVSNKLLPKAPPLGIIKGLQSLFAADVPYSEQAEGVVSLYLLHEDRSKDLLLYYADHEDEIQALWKFWSERLRLPRLLVGPDGFIDEPFPRRDCVEIRPAQRRKPFYHLNRRSPHFLRVRDMGYGLDQCRRHPRCLGREISARS